MEKASHTPTSSSEHPTMGDSPYRYPVALRWDEGPDTLRKLKNKLLIHFQKKKLSNGGECEIRDLDVSGGHLLIYFREEGVRERVLQKKPQELKLQDGRMLLLDLCLPEEIESKPLSRAPSAVCKEDEQQDEPVTVNPGHEAGTRPRSSHVLIGNVQDSCSSETLEVLVGSISNVPDFYVEMIPESCSAVVTFICDIDIQAFNEKFSNHHVTKRYNMRATALEDTKVVRVEELSPKTSEETITLHFESTRYGGGPIEKVEMMPDRSAALITFCRQEVVKSVLSSTHQINGEAISVYPYYPSIGECLYGKEQTAVKPLDPVDFQISPLLLEFFLNNAEIKQAVEDDMAAHLCDIGWPAPHCQTPVVALSVPSKLLAQRRKMSQIAPTWSKNVHSQFSLLTSKYEVKQYEVKSSVWETIKEQVSSPTYKGILFKADLVAEKVFLVGLLEDLIRSESSFKDLVIRATIEEHVVTVQPHIYKFLSSSPLVRCLQEESSNLKIEYDSTASKVKLCGLRDEVRNAKREIEEVSQAARSRAVHQDPQIIQFLSVVDNHDLSSFLFTTNNIKAMMQVRENDVLLVAASEEDLVEAEKQMKKELDCRRITIEDRRVIQMPEWDSVRINMADLLNTNKTTVVMEAIPAGAEKELVVYGLSSAVDIAYQQIHEFLMENTVVQEEMVVKSRAIMEFIEKKILDGAKYNVKITRKDNIIILSGTKQYVQEVVAHLRSAKHYSETLYIDKPGAKKFCLENEERNAKDALSMYNCAIHLEKDGQGEAAALETNLNEPLCRLHLKNGVTIAVHAENPYQKKVAVVVIVTSEDLKPIGGLEQTLLNDVVRAECESIIQKEGKLAPGESIITDAGNLPCKQLIHVVTPKCDKKLGSRSDRLLGKAIKSVLDLAADNGHTSIALSASSFTACGYPVETCAERIVTAIQQHMESQEGSSSIRYIHLVDSEDRIVKAFIQSLSDEYEEKNLKFTSKQEAKKLNAKKSRKQDGGGAAYKYNRHMVTTKEGLQIKISQGKIQDATSNVIVNSVGKDLDLVQGAVSSAIFKKAGPRLQDLLNTEKLQSAVTDGGVFITDACGLSADLVLHAVVPRWDEGRGSSEQSLRKIVSDCLSASEERGMRSVSFPAIGTGILGFPKNTVAAIMYEECLNFSGKGNAHHLKEVTFVLHPSDTETIKAFSTELEKKNKDPKSPKKSEKSHSLFGPLTSPSEGVHEMKIGPITYQVKTGDITKEVADIIVNSTNSTFNLKSGVSKKILEEAGKDVEDECVRLAPSKPSLVVSKGGKLSCRNILHIPGISNPGNLRKKVTEALTESERLQATSVAFPALGTGIAGLSATEVADVMLDAVVDFVSSKSAKSVQTVKVVIFQPPMLEDFRTSLKKKEQKPGFFSWLYHRIFSSASDQMVEEEEDKVFELRENIEPVIYQLCAGTKKDVTDASTWLRNLILKEQHENTITDDWIMELGDEEKQKIAALQKTQQVTVQIDLPSTTIKVSGLSRDVLNLSNQIQDLIKKVREKKTKEREAELCSNLVEWRYHDGNNFVPFDRMVNLELETAKRANTQNLKIDVSGVTYTVLLEIHCIRDARGKEIKIQRFLKHENILELPSSWDSMEKTQLKVVPVAATSQEYGDVHAQFAKTCQMKVVKIERIQNSHLYQNYQIKKQSIDTKNGSEQNERRLFHGTDENTVKNVNSNGFNRSYSGLNVGAVLGNGTYFAVEANYSAADQFSRLAPSGLKYMYLARVLTGVFCGGQKGMVAPPAKNPANPTDLYDSVTDHLATPKIFVIFNDVQAYPEYLITFSK